MQMDPATVIFALLAIFVLWKLRSVLGERTGLEQPPSVEAAPTSPAPQPAQIDDSLRWKEFAERGSAVWSGLDEISNAQRGFAPRVFLDGASEAYKMVVQAFSHGDEATLRSLTSDDVLASFKAALAERAEKGESLETTFVGFKDIKIVEAVADPIGARISVRFDTQFITATRDRGGVLVEGDPAKPSDIVDIWTFARRNDASGPNWTLVATSPTQ